MPAQVICVGFDDAQILDIVGPLQILSAVRDSCAPQGQAYNITLVAARKGDVTTSSGLSLKATASFEEITTAQLKSLDTLIVAGGQGVERAASDKKLLSFVKRAAHPARRVVSICSGVLVLAAAGVITTERVATHWGRVAQLRAMYPKLKVDEDAIYACDGRIWTSGGVASGIDLALALVQEDWGRRKALEIARHHVVFMMRPGGQAQFSTHLQAQIADSGRLGKLLSWIVDHVGDDLSLDVLASKAGMSERTLTRAFRIETGGSPAMFVETARLEAARRLLEESSQPLELIARRTGYHHVERLRRSFHRGLGVSPADYRSRFNPAAHGGRA